MKKLEEDTGELLSYQDADFICDEWEGFQNFVTKGKTSYEISLLNRSGGISFFKETEYMILERTYVLVINDDGIKISDLHRRPPTMHSKK